MKRSFRRASLGPSKDSDAERVAGATKSAAVEAEKSGATKPAKQKPNPDPVAAPVPAPAAPKTAEKSVQVHVYVPISPETREKISHVALNAGETDEITQTVLALKAKERFFAAMEDGSLQSCATLARDYAEKAGSRKEAKIHLRISLAPDFEASVRPYVKDPLRRFSAAQLCAGFIAAKLADLAQEL